LFPAVTFLECVVTEVVSFSVVVKDTDISQGSLATHLRYGGNGIFSDNVITNFFPDSDSKRILKIG